MLDHLELPVNEIFYSLQGEGAQVGLPMVFIRLSSCNLRCSYCDTDFSSFTPMSLEAILGELTSFPTHNILWTGGEPTLHLTEEVVGFFHQKGYRQSIETNGTRPVPRGIDYVTCSAKPEAFPLLWENFPHGVDEWRFPFGASAPLPPAIESLPPARTYCLSPIYEPGEAILQPPHALEECIEYIKQHPTWRLSIQLHKIIGIQ